MPVIEPTYDSTGLWVSSHSYDKLRQWGEEYQRANDACEVRWNEMRGERDALEDEVERLRGRVEQLESSVWRARMRIAAGTPDWADKILLEAVPDKDRYGAED